MDNYRFQQFDSPAGRSGTSTLPSSAKSNWYCDHGDGDVKQFAVLKRGWLERQPSKLFGSWKQRWAVVLENVMLWYDDERELKSAGKAVSLLGKTLLEVVPGESNGNPGKFLFQIAPGFQSCYQANDIAEGFVVTARTARVGACKSSRENRRRRNTELNSDGKVSSSSAMKNVEVFSASSEQERKEWTRALKRAMYGRVGGAIFGGPLEETLSFERTRNPGRIVPEVVEECVRFLRENALDVDGIFRMTGKKSLIRKLQERYDRGERPTLVLSSSSPPIGQNSSNSDGCDVPRQSLTSSTSSTSSLPAPCLEGTDVHSAASLLKAYLIELPQPIIPVDFYDDIMTVVTREFELDSDASVDKISSAVSRLPPNNYNLLRYLCEFLKLVGDHESQNRMTYQNLAKVFCNAILEPEVDDPALLMGTADNRAKAVTIMITYLERIFKEDWKADTSGVRRPSRLSRSCDDLCTDDGPPCSFPGDRQIIIDRFVAEASADSAESLQGIRREDESRRSGGSASTLSTSTISSFFGRLPRFNSSKKEAKGKAIPMDSPVLASSFSSTGHLSGGSSRPGQGARRSCSVRDQHTREKLSLMMYDTFRQDSRESACLDEVAEADVVGVSGGCGASDEVIGYLLSVKPKTLPVDDLIQHFYRLQENLKLEHKRVQDLRSEYEREVKRLTRDLEEQREGREQAVTRVVEVQATLENYFLKFGPL